eukprot:gene31870-40221_t
MTETAPENTVLTAAVEAYAKPDAAEWLAFMAEHSADITPMYQQIDVNDDKDDGADASITPPLIDVLRIVQQANLVRTGARPSQTHNGVNVAIVNEVIHRQTYSFECLLLSQ